MCTYFFHGLFPSTRNLTFSRQEIFPNKPRCQPYCFRMTILHSDIRLSYVTRNLCNINRHTWSSLSTGRDFGWATSQHSSRDRKMYSSARCRRLKERNLVHNKFTEWEIRTHNLYHVTKQSTTNHFRETYNICIHKKKNSQFLPEQDAPPCHNYEYFQQRTRKKGRIRLASVAINTRFKPFLHGGTIWSLYRSTTVVY